LYVWGFLLFSGCLFEVNSVFFLHNRVATLLQLHPDQSEVFKSARLLQLEFSMMPFVQSAQRNSANETVKQGIRVQQAWNKIVSWRATTTETCL